MRRAAVWLLLLLVVWAYRTSLLAAEELLGIHLASPVPDMTVRGLVPLLEVRGRVVEGLQTAYDLVIAIDLSESTLYPTGFDVNGDGNTGVMRRRGIRTRSGFYLPVWAWTTDAGDTIVQAELLAAQRLLRRLQHRDIRVGLVTFAGRAREVARLGDPETALRALERVRVRLDLSGTNLRAAVRRGVRTLQRDESGSVEGRDRILVLLSDGEATVPHTRRYAQRAALRAAREAARSGVRIFAFAIGAAANQRAGFFRELADATGGTFFSVHDPSEITRRLPHLDVARLLEVRIRNLTGGASARAVRVFEDGAFDGYVPLVPGRNDLSITAVAVGGRQISLRRHVEYRAPQSATRPDLELAQHLAERLRVRTIETELCQKVVGHRSRSLEIRVE